MRFRYPLRHALLLLAACWVLAVQALAQEKTTTPPNKSEEVVRVNTELVQTDVMVFDKQGNFVDGLKRDQFVLKVDGKQRDISFLDRITAGSRNEEAQLAAARGTASENREGKGRPVPLDRGRTVLFYVDDLHLSASSVNQTRKLLKRFIEHELRQNDEAAITSTSGQIGFLQQVTDNKAVMSAAVDRLKPKPYTAQNFEDPAMSEYQALMIDRNDTDVLDFFVEYILKQNPMLPRATAEEMVRGRVSHMLQEAAAITTNTLATLKSLVDSSAVLPGRKLLFVISDGFFLDPRNSDSLDRLRGTTSAAAAAGVVIYSIDARGLSTGLPDVSTATSVDTSGRLLRATAGELLASQDGLSALASDTGGRGFFGSNALSASVATALKESSVYYLVGWRPENEQQRNPRYRRIEVAINGRPELQIRFRRGFGEGGSADSANRLKSKPVVRKAPLDELGAALRAPYPKNGLPVAISLNFIDVPQYGATLTAALKISTTSLVLEAQGGPPTAIVDVSGAIFDDQGKSISTFNKRLTIKAKSTEGKSPPPDNIFYNHFTVIKPGLYQVRAAAIDEKQGTIGSAMEWIEIPDLGSKALTLSSLIVGEKKADSEVQQTEPVTNEPDKQPSAFRQVSLNIDHHFSRSSHLRFMTIIYNAISGSDNISAAPPSRSGGTQNTDGTVPLIPAITTGGGPDLAVQVQVFRDNEPVITAPLRKIPTEGFPDLQRLAYAAEVTLDDLQPGRYVLQVTVIDKLAKASASQRFSFQVD
jgi:VWFA-related protein